MSKKKVSKVKLTNFLQFSTPSRYMKIVAYGTFFPEENWDSNSLNSFAVFKIIFVFRIKGVRAAVTNKKNSKYDVRNFVKLKIPSKC